ncbi:hypothetical protein B7R74_21955 [Yersinia pseudotuberculosis]|uniref:Uncharacterized protein n=1 Tax=Yersinia pseudotuberculosis TaxID=633 RepID=A0A380Q3D6_YERPU|nr:3'-5' exoribonuclease [Yersinia pseudotuberculosis]PSH11159.1 hypothetical protein B7R74_21955 [Yersinia pseudotuberculosis]SUP80079.1 Uncharacterised protein [Yersinia pseudotuberculosis]
MLIFMDTEYDSDYSLISLGLVTEDGKDHFYAEHSPNIARCNRFVLENVIPQLRNEYMPLETIRGNILEWMGQQPRRNIIATDSPIDIKILLNVIGKLPDNFCGNRYDLRPLIDTSIFHEAVCEYHNDDYPWHQALNDAYAHRAGWLAWKIKNR